MKAVILAGGTGTRLWPVSRDLKPKQFHTFVGTKTMLQQTWERLAFLDARHVYISTNAQYVDFVRAQLPELNEKNLIIEPAMRDTGPSILFAAHTIAQHGFADEVMAIVYADHLMQKPATFKQALESAVQHAKKMHVLGVIAVHAKYPNPNLGYIRLGKLIDELPSGLEIFELDEFIEKPTEAAAKKFLYSYKYLWNTGLYLGPVQSFLDAFKKYAPAIYEAIVQKNTYEGSPKISIDYAVIEKIPPKEMFVMPADLGWNDIGTWAALHEELAFQARDTVSMGNHLNIGTEGSIVMSDSGKLVVTYGLKDIIIVETPDVLLVMPKEKAGDVKKVVEEIRKKGEKEYL